LWVVGWVGGGGGRSFEIAVVLVDVF